MSDVVQCLLSDGLSMGSQMKILKTCQYVTSTMSNQEGSVLCFTIQLCLSGPGLGKHRRGQ